MREVTSTLAKTSDHINYLTVVDGDGNEQVIETTDVHPFWVVTDEPDLDRAAREFADGMHHENLGVTDNGYWVEAKDLRVGDVFLGANGEFSTLINIVRVEQAGGIAVFNFKVEGNHNYFILAKEFEYGQSCILVHNADCFGEGWGDIGSHDKMHPDDALDRGLDWLDHDYTEIAEGVFRSKIHPERQFRMKDVDLDPLGHGLRYGGSHVHFEVAKPDGTIIENLHIYLQ